MVNQLNKVICETVNSAFEKKSKELRRDVTYVCIVEGKVSDPNMYKLKYNNVTYFVTLSNISPKENEKVHLVFPQGNSKDKYVLEDVIAGYNTGGSGSGSGSNYEHPKTNVASGEYNYVTVNEYGHVTSARNVLIRDELLHDENTLEDTINNALNKVNI